MAETPLANCRAGQVSGREPVPPDHGPVGSQETATTAVPRLRYFLVFAIVFGGLLADLLTKSLVFQRLGVPGPFVPNQRYWIWENVLGFETSLNEGALFGMGQGLWMIFAAASVIASAIVVGWLFFYGAIRDRLLTITLSCVLAGILGNLYDRLGLPGLRWSFANDLHNVGDPTHAVRDWILVMLGTYHWPNFNIADSLLVCGACLLMFHAFYRSEPSATC